MGATLRDGLLLKRRGYAWLRRRASLRTFVAKWRSPVMKATINP